MFANISMPLQGGDAAQAARDLSQEIRDQIRAAQQEARAAQKGQLAVPPNPPIGTTPVVQIPFDPNRSTVPRQAVGLSIAFFLTVAVILLGLPIARAIARRLDRTIAAPRVAPEISNQLNQLSQAVDAIALEVERISEGQRFTTRLLAEQQNNAQRTVLGPASGGTPAGS